MGLLIATKRAPHRHLVALFLKQGLYRIPWSPGVRSTPAPVVQLALGLSEFFGTAVARLGEVTSLTAQDLN